MIKQRIVGLLLSLSMIGSLFAYSETKDGVTLSIVDYSKRPMTSFFSELPNEYFVSLLNVNLFTRLYPLRFNIANNGTKTYKLGPNQIGGTISIDYEKIVKQLPIQIEGNGDYLATVLGASEGLMLGGLVGMLAGIHHLDAENNESLDEFTLDKFTIWKHIKKCKSMKILTGASAALGTVGILSTIYAVVKANKINAERRKWIKKNALSQEGVVIKPGEQVEVVVFLTHETYNREHLMVSLVEPGLGNTLEPFNVPLAS